MAMATHASRTLGPLLQHGDDATALLGNGRQAAQIVPIFLTRVYYPWGRGRWGLDKDELETDKGLCGPCGVLLVILLLQQ